MKKLVVALGVMVLLALATPAQAANTWTTVRSVSQSTETARVYFKDGSFDILTPGESTYYYASEPRVVQKGYGNCMKVSLNGGSFWVSNDPNYDLVDGGQYAFKFWRC